MLEAIDIAPTLLSIAGRDEAREDAGRAFLGDHAEPAHEMAFGARDRCDETVFRFRTVRDARYRYIKNFTPEVPFLATERLQGDASIRSGTSSRNSARRAS